MFASVRFGLVWFVAPAMMDATNCCRMFIIVTWISSSFPVPVAAASTVRGGVTTLTHTRTHSHLCPDSHALTHTHARSIVLAARAFYLWHLEPQRQEPSAHWDLISDVPRKWLRYVWASNAGDPNASNVDCDANVNVSGNCDANCEGCDLFVVLFCFVSHSAARLNVPLSFPAPLLLLPSLSFFGYCAVRFTACTVMLAEIDKSILWSLYCNAFIEFVYR